MEENIEDPVVQKLAERMQVIYICQREEKEACAYFIYHRGSKGYTYSVRL